MLLLFDACPSPLTTFDAALTSHSQGPYEPGDIKIRFQLSVDDGKATLGAISRGENACTAEEVLLRAYLGQEHERDAKSWIAWKQPHQDRVFHSVGTILAIEKRRWRGEEPRLHAHVSKPLD